MDLILNFIQNFFLETVTLYNEMAIYLLIGSAFGGIIHAFFPQDKIRGNIGRRSLGSSFKAALLGVPMPLCSCSVIPTALSLKKSGASRGATVSFLISTPQTGVDSIAATYSLMGPLLAIFRPLVAFITGTIGGFLTDVLDHSPEPHALSDESHRPHRTLWQKTAAAYDYGFNRLLADIARWVVIGLLIGGAITAAVPNNFFEQSGGNVLFSYTAILLFSIPVYICATGSIPIATALILKGVSPGAAFVLLMAGPATNATSITVLFQSIGRRATLIYLAAITVGSVVFGLTFDYFFGATFQESFIQLHEHSNGIMDTVKIAGSIIFLVFLIKVFLPQKSKETPVPDKDLTSGTKYRVKGMTCGGCKGHVEKAALSVEGVTDVVADLGSGILSVMGRYDESALIKAVAEAGYPVSSLD